MENYYILQNEVQQRTNELQLQAETHRLGKERDLNLDSRRLPKALARILQTVSR